MNSFCLKLGVFIYRAIGSLVILLAIMIALLYYLLPVFVSTEEVKSKILASVDLPIQFERIEWGVWGLSPTVVIRHATVYQQYVKKITIELDWIEWLKTDKVKIKKIFFKKANLTAQFRENKIYLEDMPNHPILFDQSGTPSRFSINELVLIDSHLILRNELNQAFETKHTDINLKNTSEKFILEVKGELSKTSSPFEFGLTFTPIEKKTKAQMHISGEEIVLSDLQFFFKDILISGKAKTFNLWLEGEWGNFNRLIANGEINDFGYFYENRQLFYPYIAGQFGIEWQTDATEYLGLDIHLDPKAKVSHSQFYTRIPNQPGDITLLAKDFPLNRLDNIFTVFLADKPGLQNWWQSTSPRGTLDYFDVIIPDISDLNGHDLITQLKGISGEMLAHDLKINKNPFHLSVENLTKFSGYYLDGMGKFAIEGQNTQFQDNHYYPKGLKLDNILGTMWYWGQSDTRKLYFDEVSVTLGKAQIEYAGFWEKNLSKLTWETESLFYASHFQIKPFLSTLPETLLDKGLSEWMNTAFISGELEHARALIRGNLNDFPYANPTAGMVEVAIVVDDVTLKYEPNWPELKNADGALDLDGPKLSLYATEGEISKSAIASAKGVIQNIHDPNLKLELDAKIKSTLTKAKSFLDTSPLKEILSEKLSPLTILGPLDVSLDLKVPLNVNSPDETEYRGLLDFKKSTVKIPKLDLKISSLNGSIFFTPRGISGQNLAGILFGMPANFNIVSDVLAPDPRVKVSATGEIEVKKLNEWFDFANSDLVRGKTNYSADLFLTRTSKETEGELKIKSDLTGITINLPQPFDKKSSEKEAFDLKVQFSPHSSIKMSMKYADKIDLSYELKASNKEWAANATHVVIGKPSEVVDENETKATDKASFFSENPFSVEGYLETLDLSEWQKVLSDNKNSTLSSKFFVKLKVKKLIAFGQDFENMTVQVSSSGLSAREISILGENIKGKVVLPTGTCTSAIKADFEYLNFPKAGEKEPKSTLNEIKTKAGNCPIEVRVKKLILDKNIIENVFLHLIPEEKGFLLKNISAKAPNTSLQASGFWTLSPNSNIDLKGIIQTKDIYDTLKAGGIDSTMRRAIGQIRFDLNWEKDLTDINLSTVNGDVTIFLRNGYIKDAEPGIGRILSLLSFDNILRRLKLDFSDVTKEGLAMDKLTASFSFNEGVMKTDDLVLDSPAARVELLGQAVLNTKVIEGTVKVMPKITGSLPVAAAIAAANPAVGAVVWVADKVLGKTIQEITHYQYQLSGTIDKPKLSSGKPKK